MNFVGESYVYMRDSRGNAYPARGRLPAAMEIFPAHLVQFTLSGGLLAEHHPVRPGDIPAHVVSSATSTQIPHFPTTAGRLSGPPPRPSTPSTR